jgi:hypothetical protein
MADIDSMSGVISLAIILCILLVQIGQTVFAANKAQRRGNLEETFYWQTTLPYSYMMT